MTNLHRLPEPVPEGWVKSTLFADRWTRSWGPPEVTRTRETRGELVVERVEYPSVGVVYDERHSRSVVMSHLSLSEACAAAERAFCGCYVGAVVKWESAP